MRASILAAAVFFIATATAHAQWAPSALTSGAGRDVESVSAAIGPDGTAALTWVEWSYADANALQYVAVRSPGQDFRAPLPIGTIQDPVGVDVAPDGTVALTTQTRDGLAYGLIAPGTDAVAWRLLPGTERARHSQVGLDAAGNATVVWQPRDVPPEGEPTLRALTIAPDGTPSPPQTLDTRFPSQWSLEVAPTGQAVVEIDGVWVAYRPTATGPFEPKTRLAGEEWSLKRTETGLDATGNLYVATIARPTDNRTQEAFRSGVRPVGGDLTFTPWEVNGQEELQLAVNAGGGAEAACGCGDGLYTRAVTGAPASAVKENDFFGYLAGYAIAPDATRVGLWGTAGGTAAVGVRPAAGGTWTFTALPGPGAWFRLVLGPYGEGLVVSAQLDASNRKRLRVLSAGSAPAAGSGSVGMGATDRGGTGTGGDPARSSPAAATPVPARVSARTTLATLNRRLVQGIAADRRRIAKRGSLSAARRANTRLRAQVVALKPEDAATRRARTTLLRAVDRRARALRAAQRGDRRAARRMLDTAARDARTVAKRLR